MVKARWRRFAVWLLLMLILPGALLAACRDGGHDGTRGVNAGGQAAAPDGLTGAGEGGPVAGVLPGEAPDAGQPRSSGPGDRIEARMTAQTMDGPPSVEPVLVWRHRGTLAFNYLLGATDDALLIRGDDGGFSGFHEESTVYALDRATGELLWRIDAGFGWAEAEIDPERGEAAVLIHYDPEAGRYEERIRRLRLQDGETLWEDVLPEGRGGLHLASGAVIYDVQPENSADGAGMLRVYQADTGRPMWERGYAEPFRVLSRPGDPHVLVHYRQTLSAYRPEDGGLAWELEVGSPPAPDAFAYEHAFADSGANRLSAASRIRWEVLGNELALIDAASGGVKAVYPMKPGEIVTAIDDRRLLIARPSGGAPDGRDERYETVLFDAASGGERWTIPGFGSGASATGGRLHLLLDGVPTAVDPDGGRTIWQAAAAGCAQYNRLSRPVVAGESLLAPCGGDLIVMNAADGREVRLLRDVKLDYPDGREEDTGSGFVNVDASGDLYLGSSNGYFSRLRLPQAIPE